jgi:hypothetical protein
MRRRCCYCCSGARALSLSRSCDCERSRSHGGFARTPAAALRSARYVDPVSQHNLAPNNSRSSENSLSAAPACRGRTHTHLERKKSALASLSACLMRGCVFLLQQEVADGDIQRPARSRRWRQTIGQGSQPLQCVKGKRRDGDMDVGSLRFRPPLLYQQAPCQGVLDSLPSDPDGREAVTWPGKCRRAFNLASQARNATTKRAPRTPANARRVRASASFRDTCTVDYPVIRSLRAFFR